MTAVIIGISSGLLTIILFIFLKQFDKKLIYGLILTGIRFLYVGFAWMNLQAFIINAAQAIFFIEPGLPFVSGSSPDTSGL